VASAVLGWYGCVVAQGAWRKIYWHLFLRGALYLFLTIGLNAGAGREAVFYAGAFRCSRQMRRILLVYRIALTEECAVGAAGGRRTGNAGRTFREFLPAGSAVTTGMELNELFLYPQGEPVWSVSRVVVR